MRSLPCDREESCERERELVRCLVVKGRRRCGSDDMLALKKWMMVVIDQEVSRFLCESLEARDKRKGTFLCQRAIAAMVRQP